MQPKDIFDAVKKCWKKSRRLDLQTNAFNIKRISRYYTQHKFSQVVGNTPVTSRTETETRPRPKIMTEAARSCTSIKSVAVVQVS
ncbi:hypothetical protein RRG08_036735 [Elysia crispata]|uniref:Uncharacterized protein n=1 Tax=Elysia crispata TaxID=231223 RepID=A0AAE1CM90_9GAST|nr:hypothetical protein RRG08_036735 [Elysia crispata]